MLELKSRTGQSDGETECQRAMPSPWAGSCRPKNETLSLSLLLASSKRRENTAQMAAAGNER